MRTHGQEVAPPRDVSMGVGSCWLGESLYVDASAQIDDSAQPLLGHGCYCCRDFRFGSGN
ncbi:hypothetical protein SBBP2_990008 [Burkholderiales bacterium]|nr:hypothetical protein SBBP2_990008 [Burkholderiales bacterium]